MKTIVIGDIHGLDLWIKIVSENDFDKVVFVGDYFDSFNISYLNQFENFENILAFKKRHKDKVVLLIGNHDYHYMPSVTEQYAGYQSAVRYDIEFLFEQAIRENLVQMCHVQDKYLFSHAGVTKTWARNNDIDLDNIENSINDLFLFKPRAFKHTKGENNDTYGNDITQTPIWVRVPSLLNDALGGYTQVVGHTTMDNLTITDDLILVDTLPTSGEYLVIDGDNLIVKKV